MRKPVRLRLSRAKGFHLQAWSREFNGRDAVHCARPGPLGNPFIVGKHGTRAECVDLHEKLLCGLLTISFDKECVEAQFRHRAAVKEYEKHLRGKNLACWCSHDGPCHVDTLLRAFNRRRGR